MASLLKQSVAIIGSLIMAAGVFVPMLGIPILKDNSYMELSPGGGLILLALAGLTVLVAVTRRFWGLYITGILAVGLVVYTFFATQNRKSRVQSDLKEHIASSPIKGLSQKFVSSVSLRYGFPLMLVGSVMILAVPLVGSRLSRARREESEEQSS